MNPVAASRVLVDEDIHLSSNSVADAVAAIARKDLAPLAADIDSGKVYPAELLRRSAMPAPGAAIGRMLTAPPIYAAPSSRWRR